MYDMLHDFFFHPVTAFKRGPHGRLVFAKCVLPSVNKVYYYYYYHYNDVMHVKFGLAGLGSS